MSRSVFLIAFILLGPAAQIFASASALSDNAKRLSQSDPEYVQQDVDRMKDEVLNKKTQMLLFNHLIQQEGIESTYPILTINYVNDMSSRYRVDSILISMDQNRIYTYTLGDNSAAASMGRDSQLYKSPVVPGTHELNVEVIYRGNDAGIFSYINDYKISTTGKQTFELKKGQNIKVEVVGFEKGWILTDFKDRPDLRIKIYGANPGNPVQ